MPYPAELSADNSRPLPEEPVRAPGLMPGDRVSVDRSGSGIVMRRDEGRGEALARIREAVKGYSVDQFPAERRADRGE